MKIKNTKSTNVFNVLGFIFVTILAIFCLIPFITVVSGSFTSQNYIIKHGYSIFPREFTFAAYKSIFAYPKQIITAYEVTIFVTIVGTTIGLILISMAGYVLQRKDFPFRNKVAFYIYFTTLFGGGLIPWYIMMTKYLHLKDTYQVLIMNGLMSPFLIILMKSFMKSIPEEIVESGKVDGAGDFKLYVSLILPLAKPALATIGLFLALGYWNDWFTSSIFITSAKKFSLQYVLYNILQASEFFRSGQSANVPLSANLPTDSLKLAIAVIATGPVILFYPFVQKYFVTGLTIGAVKG